MADALQLEVVTPERMLVREGVTSIQVPAENGYLGILPGHAALLAKLGTGLMTFEAGGKRWNLAVQGGFLEVLNNHVRVLATMAARGEEIDVERAKVDMQKAHDQVFNPSLGVDPAEALEAMAGAQARVDAAAAKQSS